jgi:PIN domain nuclease of toxin-antitoxin system
MQQKSKQPAKNKKTLLDTSAIIALLRKEPGYEILEDLIANSSISSVNLSELVAVLARSGITETEIDEIITDLVPEIIPFSENLAIQAGKLTNQTKGLGLSLGDRACIATGIHHNMTIYTTDKIWQELKAPADIILVR